MYAARIPHAGLWDCQIQIHSQPRFLVRQTRAPGAFLMRLRHSGIRSHRAHHNGGKGFSLLVCPVADAMLIKLFAFHQSVEREIGIEFMRRIVGHGMREGEARCGRGLEALIAPAAIEIEAVNGSYSDEGGTIGRHIIDATPGAEQAQARHEGGHRHRTFHHFLHFEKLAAVGEGVEAI